MPLDAAASAALVKDLKKQLALVETDLRARSEQPDLDWAADLRAAYDTAFERGRTAQTWSAWSDDEIAQAAVAWVLATVFLRFCEDNDLFAGRWIAGTGDTLALAIDAEHAFYAADPTRDARAWLRQGFAALADTKPGAGILDRSHNPVWSAPLGVGACQKLIAFWREQDAAGVLVRDLGSDSLDTRFLGDLYQDLSESAKKKYALLQTPVFVEQFILDRTLTPALAEFGLDGLRLIDPTCGSGHFLLGAFDRLLAEWRTTAPGLDERELVQRALDHLHGVDLNPFAVAIARFRLAVAALHASGLRRLTEAPAFRYHLAVGDSLLAGIGHQGVLLDASGGLADHQYPAEDVHEHPGILDPGRYHVVVGNPPYITVKDKALNEAYRAAYSTCHRQYALSVPFMELFFRLAIRGNGTPAGYVGQITSNSFMKREFGSKLVREFLPQVDLTHVLDTSQVYLSDDGFGTQTVILFARRRSPQSHKVRAALGGRGERGRPADPAKGMVWTEIIQHIDQPRFDGKYVTVTDLDRAVLGTHPWSLSGGGADLVVGAIESGTSPMSARIELPVGRAIRAGADEGFIRPARWAKRLAGMGLPTRDLLIGENVRDWGESAPDLMIYPYDEGRATAAVDGLLWPFRTTLAQRSTFQGVMADAGLRWSEYMQHTPSAYRTPLSIAFAFISTHNHFVLDRGGKVFKQSAPVIKLPEGRTEDEYRALLGVLNSSVACFWIRQSSHSHAHGVGDPWEVAFELGGSRLGGFPLPPSLPLEWGGRLDSNWPHLPQPRCAPRVLHPPPP